MKDKEKKYTKEDIENRSSDYVCFDCGLSFNKIDNNVTVLTCRYSKCGLCQENKSVTHMRAFNYLNR